MICGICWRNLEPGDDYLAGFSNYKKLEPIEAHQFNGYIYHSRCIDVEVAKLKFEQLAKVVGEYNRRKETLE